jgi:hypothetical protein
VDWWGKADADRDWLACSQSYSRLVREPASWNMQNLQITSLKPSLLSSKYLDL